MITNNTEQLTAS